MKALHSLQSNADYLKLAETDLNNANDKLIEMEKYLLR